MRDTPEPEKPRVKAALTESQQFAIDAPEREQRAKAAKDERERVERVRQAEASRRKQLEFQQRRQVEMRRARQEWAQAMGCPVQPRGPVFRRKHGEGRWEEVGEVRSNLPGK